MAVLASFLDVPPRRVAGSLVAGPPRAEVALTFDDGPSPSGTPAVLDRLDRLGLPGTFFVLGSAAAEEPELVAEIAGRGHEVASHGMVHAHHLLRTPGWVRRDTAAAVGLLDALGVRPRWYRPPYGQVSAATLRAARRQGCSVVLWSGWGREFSERDPGRVLDRVLGALAPGAVLLLHDSSAWSTPGTAERTAEVLPAIAEGLEARGLSATTLTGLLG